MTQPSDDIAFSLFNLGPIGSPRDTASRAVESDFRADAYASSADSNATWADGNSGKFTETKVTSNDARGMAADANNASISAGYSDTATMLPAKDSALAMGSSSLPYNQPYNSPYNAADEYPASMLLSPLIAPIPETPVAAGYYSEPGTMYGRLSLVPSEERLPTATGYIIAPQDIIPSIGVPIAAQTESSFVPPITAAAQPELTYAPPAEISADFSPFQAPLISRLEKNKWYVQVALYGKAEYVEDEISRIGMSYPLAIQNVGTDTSPLFRVLLGPLNQGESGAMLQRFKSLGYADAFVRYN
jgi:cell division septation protein DedD